MPARNTRSFNKEVPSAQVTAQFAEKSESETKTDSQTKQHYPLFAIRTVLQLCHADIATSALSGLGYPLRFGSARSTMPLYLIKRTIRI